MTAFQKIVYGYHRWFAGTCFPQAWRHVKPLHYTKINYPDRETVRIRLLAENLAFV